MITLEPMHTFTGGGASQSLFLVLAVAGEEGDDGAGRGRQVQPEQEEAAERDVPQLQPRKEVLRRLHRLFREEIRREERCVCRRIWTCSTMRLG